MDCYNSMFKLFNNDILMHNTLIILFDTISTILTTKSMTNNKVYSIYLLINYLGDDEKIQLRI